jgi:hypothetical protein
MCLKHGLSVMRVRHLLDTRRITPPRKDFSGDYVWEPAEVERLLAVVWVDGRRKKAPEATPAGVA